MSIAFNTFLIAFDSRVLVNDMIVEKSKISFISYQYWMDMTQTSYMRYWDRMLKISQRSISSHCNKSLFVVYLPLNVFLPSLSFNCSPKDSQWQQELNAQNVYPCLSFSHTCIRYIHCIIITFWYVKIQENFTWARIFL